MSLSLIVRDEAAQDIIEASRWYEERESGLGLEYIRCIDTCLAQISRTPGLGPMVYRGARMVLPRRFPYLVIYRLHFSGSGNAGQQTPAPLEGAIAEVILLVKR